MIIVKHIEINISIRRVLCRWRPRDES